MDVVVTKSRSRRVCTRWVHLSLALVLFAGVGRVALGHPSIRPEPDYPLYKPVDARREWKRANDSLRRAPTAFNLECRASASVFLGRLDEALADYDKLLEEVDSPGAHAARLMVLFLIVSARRTHPHGPGGEPDCLDRDGIGWRRSANAAVGRPWRCAFQEMGGGETPWRMGKGERATMLNASDLGSDHEVFGGGVFGGCQRSGSQSRRSFASGCGSYARRCSMSCR